LLLLLLLPTILKGRSVLRSSSITKAAGEDERRVTPRSPTVPAGKG
jgi:hypothetical protein